MENSEIKKTMPLVLAGVVAALFGLAAFFCVQAFGGYQRQLKAFEGMQRRVRLASTQKNDLIRKERILSQTAQFLKKTESLGLSPSRWSVYDVHLQEAVSFAKADQILSQCANSQVAYFQPASLTIKRTQTPKKQNNAAAGPASPGDMQLSVQGKFLARQP